MDLVVFGLNHRTAPIGVREQWAFSEEEAREALLGARDVVSASENLILSTCNRTEIYTLFPGRPDLPGLEVKEEGLSSRNLEDLLDFFHRLKNVRRTQEAHFYTYRRTAAIEHLFRLAAGLDSMIVGEGQILRQLRDAFEVAREAGSVGKVFLRLFPAALRAGKRTRTETAISHGCITHGQAALRLARERLHDLGGKTLLLVGSGKVTRLVADAAREQGARIAVTNRTMENAVRLADQVGGEAYPLGDLPCLLETADLVVSSTGARKPLVSADGLRRVMAKRPRRPLCAVDLAVPRDFDPACAEVPGVSLYNIDDLNAVVQGNLAERRTEVPRAEAIVQEELRAFLAQMNWIHLDPVISHLMERFEAIRVAEVGRHLDGFPAEHRAAVDALTMSLVKKILHFPIEKLKSLRDDSRLGPAEIAFLRRLFLTEPQGRSDGSERPFPSPDRKPG